jgi:hypothetical protein
MRTARERVTHAHAPERHSPPRANRPLSRRHAHIAPASIHARVRASSVAALAIDARDAAVVRLAERRYARMCASSGAADG